MKKHKADKVPLAVVVIVDKQASSGFSSGNVNAWVTCYVAEIKRNTERGFEYVSSYGDHGSLSKIIFRELLSSDHSRGCGTGSLISGDLSHDAIYHIEPVLKRMKAIAARMEVLRTKYGQPADFAQAVLRFADAVGAGAIITENDAETVARCGSRYRESEPNQGAYNITANITAWYAKYAPKTEEATVNN